MGNKKPTTKQEETAIAPVANQLQDEAALLISQAIDKAVPVETMEKLLAMRRELRAEKAKEAFDFAMKEFQRDCPTIQKTTQGYNYKYADLTAIVEQVKALLSEKGFSYTFDTEESENKVIILCKVKHIGGHMEVSKAYITKETTTKMNASQQSGAAMTYGKRYAFVNAFGILTGDEDTDARTPHNHPMTPRQMAEHKEHVQPKPQPEEPPMITAKQQVKIRQLMIQMKVDMDYIEGVITSTNWNGHSKTKLSDLTEQDADSFIKGMEKKISTMKANKEEGEPSIDLDEAEQGIETMHKEGKL